MSLIANIAITIIQITIVIEFIFVDIIATSTVIEDTENSMMIVEQKSSRQSVTAIFAPFTILGLFISF